MLFRSLRNAIHYRSWGQKDPLIEYKTEAYTMFVDLMHDVHHTFAERFLRVQVVFDGQDASPQRGAVPTREEPRKRYNAPRRARNGRCRTRGYR